MKKMYVDVNEICEDWGVSKPKAYTMIKELNTQLKEINPNFIVIAGKVNRKYYEETCYGQIRKERENVC